MDWDKICTNFYNSGYYSNESLKVFVVKGKITTSQYLAITGVEYVA